MIYKSKQNIIDNALISKVDYKKMYLDSINDPVTFWEEQGKRLDWFKPYKKVREYSYDQDNLSIKWYEDGQLNVSYNCIDRHLEERANKVAILWEGDDPSDVRKITYKELFVEVSKFSNSLKSIGVKKGDRVTIYMPMIPEATFAMLACTRIGAIHSVVFGGFSPEALAGRIVDCKSEYIITADEGVRGGKIIPLKKNVDEAIEKSGFIKKCVVVKRTGNLIDWNKDRDCWYHELLDVASEECLPEIMNAEDSLFILYTSGSTGKPKGILHTTGGYLVYSDLQSTILPANASGEKPPKTTE